MNNSSLTDQDVLVAFLLSVGLAVKINLNRVDGREMMKVEMFTPETELGLDLGCRPGVESAVEAHLAEVTFLRRYTLSLEQPDLQGIVRSPGLLRVWLH